jgi:hypothetical protein
MGGSERNYNGWEGKILESVLKISRQCPLVLPVRIKHLNCIIEV